MSFRRAIQRTPAIARCLKDGLKALGANRHKVQVSKPRALQGSVDIDKCLKEVCPNDPRWDYTFGYHDHVYYVEVHPVSTGEVQSVINKLAWLRTWRKQNSPALENLSGKSSYHWIATEKSTIAITKGSKYYLLLAQNKISGPQRILQL